VKFLPLCLAFASSFARLSAAVVYSGEQNLSVAWDDLEGIYVNLATGATATTVSPEDFDAAPWINLTLGGYGIFNSELIKPRAVSGGAAYDPEQATDYYLNLDPGTLLGASTTFMDGAFGSIAHVGTSGDPDKFVQGESGLLGFSFQETSGGDTYYGWLRFIPESSGSGTLVDWAYNDTAGGSIEAGAVPEPSSAVLLAAACGLFAVRRRRA
jgi:hypothetical protein